MYAVNTANDGVIKPNNLPDEISGLIGALRPESDYDMDLASAENNLSIKKMVIIAIIQAFLQTAYNYNVSEAAGRLGMSRSTLYRKIKEYNLYEQIRSRLSED